MIVISITLSQEGVVEELVAKGHAGMSLRGQDIVCAAFTVLLRTFARSVEAASGVAWSLRADDSGSFHMAVESVSLDAAEQYRGWCSFLLRGFEDLSGDFPSSIRIQYGSHSGRLFHGS